MATTPRRSVMFKVCAPCSPRQAVSSLQTAIRGLREDLLVASHLRSDDQGFQRLQTLHRQRRIAMPVTFCMRPNFALSPQRRTRDMAMEDRESQPGCETVEEEIHCLLLLLLLCYAMLCHGMLMLLRPLHAQRPTRPVLQKHCLPCRPPSAHHLVSPAPCIIDSGRSRKACGRVLAGHAHSPSQQSNPNRGHAQNRNHRKRLRWCVPSSISTAPRSSSRASLHETGLGWHGSRGRVPAAGSILSLPCPCAARQMRLLHATPSTTHARYAQGKPAGRCHSSTTLLVCAARMCGDARPGLGRPASSLRVSMHAPWLAASLAGRKPVSGRLLFPRDARQGWRIVCRFVSPTFDVGIGSAGQGRCQCLRPW